MSTYNYAFFKKLEIRLQQRTDVDIDIRDVIRSYAKAKQSVGYTCFAISCLGCCCCSKCANVCLESADTGGFWIKSLFAYDGLSNVQVNQVFTNAMNTLRGIETRLKNHLESMYRISEIAYNHGDATVYKMNDIKTSVVQSQLTDGTWASSLMKNVLFNSVQYNHPYKIIHISIASVLPLEIEEFQSLVPAIGILFPMCFNDGRSYSLNTNELSIIKQATTATMRV